MNRVIAFHESFASSRLNPRTQTIEMRALTTRGALDPQSLFIQVWHQVLLAGIVYELFIIPFMITFNPHVAPATAPEMVGLYVWELLFLADFFVKLNTGFYEGGNVHRNLRKAQIKYLKSAEFAMDVVGIFPYSLIPTHFSTSRVVLEVPKLVRLLRLPQYLGNLDDFYAKHFEVLKLTKVVVGIALLSHCVACIRFAFGYDEHHSDHWLPRLPDDEHTPQRKYLMSLFWSFGVLSGLFEGELPHSILEFVFTITVALGGFSIFTLLCATFFMLSKCESGETEAAEGRINQLKHILAFHRVSDELQTQAVEYLRLYYTDADSNEREVMKLLCPSIATDIQIELMKDTIARVPIFSGCSDEFAVALTSLLERISLPAQCTLFQAGDFGDAMYIIHSGVLDVIIGNAKVRELRKNDFVGELSLFSNSPRTATVVTTTYCVLYKLSRFHTERVLDGYPRVARSIANAVEQFLERAKEQKAKEEEASRVGPSTFDSPEELASRPATPVCRRGSGIGAQLGLLADSAGLFKKKASSVVAPAAAAAPVKANIVARGSVVAPQLPLLRRVLTVRKRKGSEAMKVFYDQYVGSKTATKRNERWSSLLLKQCIDAESTNRLWWLLVLQIVLVVNWVAIPLQLAFDLLDKPSWYIYTVNALVDLTLFADVYVNLNLSYMRDAEKILDPTRSAVRYLRGAFWFDLLCCFPYCVLAPSAHFAVTRIPRLLRIGRTWGHYQELDKIYHLHSKQRLLVFGLVLFLLIHVVCCLHFSVTHIEGFNTYEDSWLPCDDIELRASAGGVFVDHLNATYAASDPHVMAIARTQYARSFYYAANVLTGLGRTMEPDSNTQYAIALLFMSSGFMITAVVVDNVQKRFTASAYDEKQFFAVRSRIQLFLRRQHAPFSLHQRVNTFLDYWWAAHRGALIGRLLVDLPLGYRREILRSVCKPALQTLALLLGVRPCLNALEEVFVDNAQFILYGQDEVLYEEGDNAHGLFFLLEGGVKLTTRLESKAKDVPLGGCFGTRALQTEAEAQSGYAETAIAASGCVVLFFSREKLALLHAVFPPLESALSRLEKRLLDTKLSKSAFAARAGGASGPLSTNPLVRCLTGQSASIDPDSKFMAAWETWLFVAMTVQWMLVIQHICFGVANDKHWSVDGVTVALEASFLVDVYMRTRVGYHEFGNKVMDPAKIRRRYFRSRAFAVDVLALLPLFAINWTSSAVRLEIFNINKLLRLLKVPTQFQALEERYLKLAMELRLFKLLYYTFLLAHFFGSLYFDFAAHASQVYSLGLGQARETNFGSNKWLPSAELEHAPFARQYSSSVFWAFGLMSASQQGELPKTSVQCVFSVATMIAGFFLFAYVVGNFADIIELVDAENREFNDKLGSMRHLLAHFTIPPAIEAKMKTFFFFKRFHSITQEELLADCLPPSLVTDIRLVNLHTMIVKVPFLGNMEGAITRMLVSHFSQVLVLKDDYVYRQGDDGTDMFFVFTGILNVLIPVTVARKPDFHRSRGPGGGNRPSTVEVDVKALKRLSEITSGDFFGENALFSDAPRNAFVRAKTSCILYALSRQSLEMVFELYPRWKKHVLQTVKIQQKQQRLNAPSNDRRQREGGASQRSERTDTSAAVDNEEQRCDASSNSVDELPPVGAPAVQSVMVAQGVVCHLPPWARALLLGVEAQSPLHLLWLRVVAVSTGFIAIIVPYRLAFDACSRWTPAAATANLLQIACTLIFALDVWVNWKLKESEVSIEIYEEKHRDSYTSGRLLWDVVAALPVDYLALPFAAHPLWFCLPRCVKVANIVHYMNEIHRQSVSYEWARFKTIWLLYLLAMYWSACVYLGVASLDGYGTEWNGWLPTEHVHITDPSRPSSAQLGLRIFRGVFFAVTAFVKKGRTFAPESTSTDVFTIGVCFVGLLTMSFMIGEISSLYISFIGNEVKFRKDQIEVELYLSHWKIGAAMKARVRLFLATLWSSHRGVNYQHVFDELPRSIRRETVLHIAELPMKALMTRVFRPLAHGDAGSIKVLTGAIADKLRFEIYPRGEWVVVEGTIPKGMFFVVKGQLAPSSKTHAELCRDVRYKKGSFFGEQGLLGYSVSEVSVRTVKASDLLSLSTDGLLSALQTHSYFSIALKLVKELFDALRSAHGGVIPRSRDVWASQLKKILVRYRMEWALSLSSPALTEYVHHGEAAPADTLPPFAPFASMSLGARGGSERTLPKGATLWSAVLAGVLDTDAPYTCLQMFETFLELIVPVGELYDKTPMPTPSGAKTGSAALAGDRAGSRRMKNIVQQITAGRLRMPGVVTKKLPQPSGALTQSQPRLPLHAPSSDE
ncbi:hypothetical protein PybrP1_009543 [[Pythium] brassicae (nom. inval.)]|nr:hypothetical protein PybrP1_009543 [[Pythium] brassicae (nom. inval.)]